VLTPGVKLGSYEVLAPLGAGGMGEVYQARDTKLDREVALKVLPETFASDSDRLARFEREVKAVAALSHPNILAIHDFGREDGVVFAVTELLKGETLRERLDRGPVTQRRAVEIAIQIARGLAAAHGKGIVHRDLKPDNVFLTEEGHVKILDFGLAKRTEPGAAGFGTSTPTAIGNTEPGTVMGTAAYMSPEQVRGRELDARSDLFSFGAILYEMLRGRQAFRGESVIETMNAIVKEEPPEFPEDERPIDPGLDRIVRHCLEKSPEARFQSAGDVAFDLETLSGVGPRTGVSAGVPAVSRGGWWRFVIVAAAGLGALALFVGGRFSAVRFNTESAARPVAFHQVTDVPGVESSPSLSPDGQSVVYVAETNGRLALYLQRIGGRNSELLTGDSDADDWQPAFSPDGQRIAFRSERDGGGIFIMGATGESTTRLTDFGYNPSWSPDGREIVVATGSFILPTDIAEPGSKLVAVDVSTGKTRAVLSVGSAFQPSWSPHGYRIAYFGLHRGGQRDLWTVAADGSGSGSAGVEVTNDPAVDWSPVWSPDGAYLYYSSTRGGTMNLWRLRIDEASGRVLGPPEPMTTPCIWAGQPSFSRDGSRFAYASLDWRSTLVKIGFEPGTGMTVGSAIPILKSTRPIRDHEISPDGRWVAFVQAGSQEDLVVARIDGTEYRRLTDDSHRNRGPVWSPDGQWIVFYSDRSGSYQLWRIRPDGSGLEQLTNDPRGFLFAFWSPDGSQLAAQFESGGGELIDMRSNARPRPARVIPPPDPGSQVWPFGWTPDGKRLVTAVLGPDGTIPDLAVYSLETGRYERLDFVRNAYWEFPLWLSDGRRLVVRTPHGIYLIDSVTKKARMIVSVGGYSSGECVGITPDDRWITYDETGTEGDIWLAEMR
jgi:Tol biopolymer transport system component